MVIIPDGSTNDNKYSAISSLTALRASVFFNLAQAIPTAICPLISQALDNCLWY